MREDDVVGTVYTATPVRRGVEFAGWRAQGVAIDQHITGCRFRSVFEGDVEQAVGDDGTARQEETTVDVKEEDVLGGKTLDGDAMPSRGGFHGGVEKAGRCVETTAKLEAEPVEPQLVVADAVGDTLQEDSIALGFQQGRGDDGVDDSGDLTRPVGLFQGFAVQLDDRVVLAETFAGASMDGDGDAGIVHLLIPETGDVADKQLARRTVGIRNRGGALRLVEPAIRQAVGRERELVESAVDLEVCRLYVPLALVVVVDRRRVLFDVTQAGFVAAPGQPVGVGGPVFTFMVTFARG